MKKNFNKKILLLIIINSLFQFNSYIKSMINLQEDTLNKIKINIDEIFFDYGIYTSKKENGKYILFDKFKENNDFTNLYKKTYGLIKNHHISKENPNEYTFRKDIHNILLENNINNEINNFIKKYPDLCWAYYKKENNKNYFIMNEFDNNGNIIKIINKSLDINQN